MTRIARQRRAGVVSIEFLILLPIYLFVGVAFISMNDLFQIDSAALMNARLRAWHSSGSNSSALNDQALKLHRYQQNNVFTRSFMGVLALDGTHFTRTGTGRTSGILADIDRPYPAPGDAPEEFSAPWDFDLSTTASVFAKGILSGTPPAGNQPPAGRDYAFAFPEAFVQPGSQPPADSAAFNPRRWNWGTSTWTGNEDHRRHSLHLMQQQSLMNAMPYHTYSRASYPGYAQALAQNAVGTGLRTNNAAGTPFIVDFLEENDVDHLAWKYRRFGQSQATLYSRLVGTTGMLERFTTGTGDRGTGLGVGEQATDAEARVISADADYAPVPAYAQGIRFQRSFSTQMVLLGGFRGEISSGGYGPPPPDPPGPDPEEEFNDFIDKYPPWFRGNGKWDTDPREVEINPKQFAKGYPWAERVAFLAEFNRLRAEVCAKLGLSYNPATDDIPVSALE